MRGLRWGHEGMIVRADGLFHRVIVGLVWLLCASGTGLAREGNALPTVEPHTVRVAVIPVRGEINVGTARALERLLRRAREDAVSVVMLEVNSPGGALDACEAMCRQLRDLVEEGRGSVRTMAYVESDAISAAAIISLACQRIVMRRDARIGDAQAILATPGSVEVAPEKVQSYVRSLVRALAQANGYPERVCEAMVDQDMEVYRVTVDGGERLVTAEELAQMEGEKTGQENATRKKELIVPKGKILTLTASEAKSLGVSSATVGDLLEAVRFAGGSAESLVRYAMTPAERVVQFLNTMAVTTALLTIGLIAAYIAFKTPGIGAPEAVAVLCFGIFFASHYLADLADYLDMIIFVVGAALLVVEIFVTPGFGVLGVIGIVCVVASLILAMQRFVLPDPRIPFEVRRFTDNLITVFSSVFLSLVGFAVFLRYLPESSIFRSLRLESTESVQGGYVAESADRRDLVGHRGVALTPLRPVGRADIGGETFIVVADGEFVEAGETIVVQEVAANRIMVRRT